MPNLSLTDTTILILAIVLIFSGKRMNGLSNKLKQKEVELKKSNKAKSRSDEPQAHASDGN